MKNFLIKTTMGEIPIDHDELPKYLEAKRRRTLALFRQGVFDGSLLSILVEDYNRRKGMNTGHEDKTRPAFSNEKPLPDLFAEVRKNLENKNITLSEGRLALGE